MARRPSPRKPITHKPGRTLRRLPTDEQKRLESLMTGNNEGTLSDRERRILQRLVREVEKMTLDNARALVIHRHQSEGR